eukprot:scaffold5805_cov48-Phaeocystis_antarctica.AAC.1
MRARRNPPKNVMLIVETIIMRSATNIPQPTTHPRSPLSRCPLQPHGRRLPANPAAVHTARSVHRTGTESPPQLRLYGSLSLVSAPVYFPSVPVLDGAVPAAGGHPGGLRRVPDGGDQHLGSRDEHLVVALDLAEDLGRLPVPEPKPACS